MPLRRSMRLTLLVWVSIAALCASAAASDTHRVMLEDLTWTELREEIRAGKTIVIVPIGGTEQNGPHMTLGKHNVRVKALAEKVARRLGNAIVAPVVAYVPEGAIDPPSGHMRFTGTITISERAFESMLDDVARSLIRHGFRDVVMIGDHGGYLRSVRIVADRLNRSVSPARVHAIDEYYRLADTDFRALLLQRGLAADEIGTHAGLADTSLMLALAPATVRVDLLARAPSRADGVYGDPRRSSADLGQMGVDAIVAGTADAIRKAVAHRARVSR